MGWNMDREVPKEGEKLYDYKFKSKSVNKKTRFKKTLFNGNGSLLNKEEIRKVKKVELKLETGKLLENLIFQKVEVA